MDYISIRAFFDMEISDTELAVVWSVFLLLPEVPVSILVSSKNQVYVRVNDRGRGSSRYTVFDLHRKRKAVQNSSTYVHRDFCLPPLET